MTTHNVRGSNLFASAAKDCSKVWISKDRGNQKAKAKLEFCDPEGETVCDMEFGQPGRCESMLVVGSKEGYVSMMTVDKNGVRVCEQAKLTKPVFCVHASPEDSCFSGAFFFAHGDDVLSIYDSRAAGLRTLEGKSGGPVTVKPFSMTGGDKWKLVRSSRKAVRLVVV